MRRACGVLTTATVVQTGKGQDRGARSKKPDVNWYDCLRYPDLPIGRTGRVFCAPEQEQSGAESITTVKCRDGVCGEACHKSKERESAVKARVFIAMNLREC
jgi:hypothetical protein